MVGDNTLPDAIFDQRDGQGYFSRVGVVINLHGVRTRRDALWRQAGRPGMLSQWSNQSERLSPMGCLKQPVQGDRRHFAGTSSVSKQKVSEQRE